MAASLRSVKPAVSLCPETGKAAALRRCTVPGSSTDGRPFTVIREIGLVAFAETDMVHAGTDVSLAATCQPVMPYEKQPPGAALRKALSWRPGTLPLVMAAA